MTADAPEIETEEVGHRKQRSQGISGANETVTVKLTPHYSPLLS